MSANTGKDESSFSANVHCQPKSPKEVLSHSPQSKSRENHFCAMALESASLRVIIYLPKCSSTCSLVQRLCESKQYSFSLAQSMDELLSFLKDIGGQVVVVIDVSDNELSILFEYIQSSWLMDSVTLMGIYPINFNLSSTEFVRLSDANVTRLIAEEECERKFLVELQLMERVEIALKHRINFNYALLTAVEQCNDAIQITGENSKIMYVNRSFLDMSGYTREEVLEKPAVDILKCSDPKVHENGPKVAFAKDQSWDGVCTGRRKSGSVIKQHLKLLPVVISPERRVMHHVTIQKLLPFESDHYPRTPKLGAMKKSGSLSGIPVTHTPAVVETPITTVLQTLASVRESADFNSELREAIEKAMDILINLEQYSQASSTGHKDIVSGLLQTGRRASIGDSSSRAMNIHHLHTRRSLISPPPIDVSKALENVNTWEFDIIGLEKITSMTPLYHTGMAIFKDFSIGEVLDVDDSVIASWLKLMECKYHRSNTYHNSSHAADVLQATAYLISLLDDHLALQGDILEPKEKAAMLITAVIHDLDHPGRTNPFLCNTNDQLAILYNDSAVLENHHAALSFKLTGQHKDTNIFQSLDNATYKELRTTIIDLVLATDMAKHFDYIAKFKNILVIEESGCSSTTSLSKDRGGEGHHLMLQRMLVKCADISNACRPQHLCHLWAKRISEEYFSQTAEEKEKGLPVVFPDFDEETCNLPQTQVKFIDFFVLGLFGTYNSYCSIPTLMDHLSSNYAYWKSLTIADKRQT